MGYGEEMVRPKDPAKNWGKIDTFKYYYFSRCFLHEIYNICIIVIFFIMIDDEKTYIHAKYMGENTSMKTSTEETILMFSD